MDANEKAKAKKAIEDYTMRHQGLHYSMGAGVKVVNLRKRKTQYIADIIIIKPEERSRERISDVEYPFNILNLQS
jgi:hypothetical protein